LAICRAFYGPGGPYALFTGKDASRALAKMSFELQDLTGDISGLGPFELDSLQDWEYRFMSKYVKVGTVKKIVPVEDGNTTSTAPATNEETTVATEPEKAPATEEKPREAVTEEVKEKEAPADKEAAAKEATKES
jgi:membrane-associated progesterone receptor component